MSSVSRSPPRQKLILRNISHSILEADVVYVFVFVVVLLSINNTYRILRNVATIAGYNIITP